MARPSIGSRIGASVAFAALFSIAACSDSTITPPTRGVSDGANLTQTPDIIDATGRHVFHTKQWHDADNAAGNAHGHGGGGGTSTGISYHGGPVLQSGTDVVAVYWASDRIYVGGPTPGTSGAGSADGSLIGTFLRGLGPSPYFNINSTYTNGSGAAIANIVNYTAYWANNSSVPSNGQNVSDAAMVAMLQSGFDSGALSYDPNALYAIFTAGTVNLGGGFGTQYCAYHWYATVNIGGSNATIRYAAMPYDHAYSGACDMFTSVTPPNGTYDPGADAEVNTLAHETEETTTDEFGSAWFDSRGYENADKCAWTFGTTYRTSAGGTANMNIGGKDFLIQRNWVNAGTGGCLLHYP